MERGLNIPQSERTKTTSSLLVSLMKQLEKVPNFFDLDVFVLLFDQFCNFLAFRLSNFE